MTSGSWRGLRGHGEVVRCGAWGPAGAGGHGALAQQHRVSHTILNLNTTTTTHLAQQQVHVLNTSHPGLQLLGPLLSRLLLLLDQPDLIVDGVKLLLEHASQGLRGSSTGLVT